MVRPVIRDSSCVPRGKTQTNTRRYREELSQPGRCSQYLIEMRIQENIPLAPLTTFRIGGNARRYCAPQTTEEIREALAFAREHDIPWFALGRGSNLLVADEGFDGLVIHTHELNWVMWDAPGPGQGAVIRCGAGCATAVLASQAAERGLAGLEFAGGLPGSIGGASAMNARAYGGELAGVFVEAEIVSPGGEITRLERANMRYAYKTSALLQNGAIAAAVTLTLTPAKDSGDAERIRAETEENKNKRANMGQFRWPSAGCVFKNNYDIGIPSGRLIDDAGLKGLRAGGAMVFEGHANFIVNSGGARAADVRALIGEIKKIIYEKYGFMLEEEITYLGF